MERKDAYLIIILIVIAFLLGYVIAMVRPPLAVLTKPGQSPTIINVIYHPKPKAVMLSTEELMSGIMVLSSEKGMELTPKQKSEVKGVIDEIRTKQEDYKKIQKDLDSSKKKMESILITKQLKFLKENRADLFVRARSAGSQGGAPGQTLLEELEKSIAGKK